MNVYIVSKRLGDELMYYVFSPSNLYRLVQKHNLEGFVYSCCFDASEVGLHGVQVLLEDWPALQAILNEEKFYRMHMDMPFFIHYLRDNFK